MIHITPLSLSEASSYLLYTYSDYEQYIKENKEKNDLPLILIGATTDGQRPIGLALARKDGQSALLLSIAVKKSYQNRGIGKKMMDALEEEAKKHDVGYLKVRYYEVRHIQRFEKLLQKAGWQPPVVISRYYNMDLERVRSSIWMKRRFPIPLSYDIISWEDMDREELAEMDQLKEAGFQPYFQPLKHSDDILPTCSFIIKQRGEIAGWSIMEQTVPRIVKYRALYIREAYRDVGLGLRLAMESVRRLPYRDNDKGVIEITANNKSMLNVAGKIQSTLQPVIYECRKSEKRLRKSSYT